MVLDRQPPIAQWSPKTAVAVIVQHIVRVHPYDTFIELGGICLKV